MQLKPIDEQVMVITGATSGIGLTTARMAAREGARVMLAARNKQALRRIVDDIREHGGQASHFAVDVASEEGVRALGRAAVEEFGRIDTWFNNAAVSAYGRLTEITIPEHRRIFDTNYFGIVNGSRTAVEHLQHEGGALINMASALADRAIPKQGPYCASKHAIKGFTDALRMEIEEDGLPISVTLIKPSSIDTPYKQHAKNYMQWKPKNPPPVYAPDVVARAVINCAQHPRRAVLIGGAGRAVSTIGMAMPRLSDLVMEHVMSWLQTTDEAAGPREHHNLFHPIDDGEERGIYPHHVCESSLYTQARLHPVVATLAVAGLAAGAMLYRRSR